MKPPRQIDGADVLWWSWSDEPFGRCGDTPVHGFAICRYAKGSLDRFSCDRNWETVNDAPWDTEAEAMRATPTNYDADRVQWTRWTE